MQRTTYRCAYRSRFEFAPRGGYTWVTDERGDMVGDDGAPSFDSPRSILPVTRLTARNCSLVWFSPAFTTSANTPANPAIAFAPRMHKHSASRSDYLQCQNPSQLSWLILFLHLSRENITHFSKIILSAPSLQGEH